MHTEEIPLMVEGTCCFCEFHVVAGEHEIFALMSDHVMSEHAPVASSVAEDVRPS